MKTLVMVRLIGVVKSLAKLKMAMLEHCTFKNEYPKLALPFAPYVTMRWVLGHKSCPTGTATTKI
jgi:hypothetical protein